MDTSSSRNISVLEPIGAAVDKTSQILFRPFNFSKWLAIGFAAWLAYLGTGGGFHGGGGGGGDAHGINFPCGPDSGSFQHEVNELKNSVLPYLPLILSVGVFLLIALLAIGILILWLRSRGQFIFLNTVARNSTQIANPWRRYAHQGNSLFLFKLVLAVLHLAAIFVFMIPLGLIIWAFARADFEFLAVGQIVLASLMGLSIFVVTLLFAAVSTLTIDLVVPVMYVQKLSVTDAWKRLLKMISEHKLTILLYLLIIFLVSIVLGIASAAIFFAACCCFCCISWVFVIPLIGGYLFKVLTLPLWVWRRAYSAFFLAQFGPEYDVFINPDAPAAAAPAAYVPSPAGDQPPHSPDLDFM